MKKLYNAFLVFALAFSFQSEFVRLDKTDDLKMQMFQPLAENEIAASEDVVFSIPSSDIIQEKIAVNPHFVFDGNKKPVFALSTVNIYDSPEKEKRNIVKTIDKRTQINTLGYNSFNDTYEFISDSGETLYIDAKDFNNDLNLIFDKIEGKKYISKSDIKLKEYPSSDAKTLKNLGLNDYVELLNYNGQGYVQVKIKDITGFVPKEFLTDKRINYVTPAQRKIADLAIKSVHKNQGLIAPKPGYCAAWVYGLYRAAGYSYNGRNAIDYWIDYKSSGSTDRNTIPIGAVVVGSSSHGPYGHVGIYVGDTNGNGEGEVVDNVNGIISKSELSDWLRYQTGRWYNSRSGQYYGPGFIGWVWPGNKVLGTGR